MKKYKPSDEVKDFLELANEGSLRLEPARIYDQGIVGVDSRGRLVYSAEKIVNALVMNNEMDYSEAVEYIEFNTIQSVNYASSEKAPIILTHICSNAGEPMGL